MVKKNVLVEMGCDLYLRTSWGVSGLSGEDRSHWTSIISYHVLGTLGPTAARLTGNHSEELSQEQPSNIRIHPVCSGGQRSASVAFLPGGEPSQEPLPRLGSMWERRKDASNSQADPQLSRMQRLLQATDYSGGREGACPLWMGDGMGSRGGEAAV